MVGDTEIPESLEIGNSHLKRMRIKMRIFAFVYKKRTSYQFYGAIQRYRTEVMNAG